MRRMGFTPLQIFAAVASIAGLGCEAAIGADFSEKTHARSCVVHPGDLSPATSEANSIEIVFALHRFDAGDRVQDGGSLVGSTLGITAAERGSCEAPPGSPWVLVRTDPGHNGRVNAFAAAAHEFANALTPLGPDATTTWVIAQRVEDGTETNLLRVRGYNQLRDDPEVVVDIFSGTTRAADTGHVPPAWDGTDTWYPIGSRVLILSNGWKPRASVRGSVSRDRLVIAAQEARVPNWYERLELDARLERTPSGWQLSDGTLAGTISMQSLFAQAGQTPLILCRSQTGLYQQFKHTWCRYRDVDADGDGRCDAFSAGQTFEGVEARLGCEPGRELDRCESAIDPRDDRCEPE
jgi:hypothetical protein